MRKNKKKQKTKKKLLGKYHVNNDYILYVYQGKLSRYDIVLRYKQRIKGKWSRLRTPKHIHWAVDMLIKLYHNEKESKKFLEFLLQKWSETEGFKSEKERRKFLKTNRLFREIEKETHRYQTLSRYGEYSVKFLLLLALLLMKQEKTNKPDAYMFKELLEALKKHKEIYKIVSKATYKGK